MEFMTITEVSRKFQISTRMLRYYEKAGLILSARKEDYSYRVYDEAAVRRLQQILVLRKLRIPVKQIALILNDEQQKKTLEILQENVQEVQDEIEALTVIRELLQTLVSRLDERLTADRRLELLEEKELLEVIDVLNPPKTNLKEEKNMEDLTKAAQVLEEKMDVRIVYLPPATVASFHYIGENPEDPSGEQLYRFIRESKLPEKKPDFRIYGFNNPSPEEGEKIYGYEFWATIPEDMEVSAPGTKRNFAGGLYAAHCIKMGDFHEWKTFFEAVGRSEEYEVEWRAPGGMGGCLEEELNAYTNLTTGADSAQQLDLLIPIKKRARQA